ncbi:hypothetical protein AFLA_007881 [Aspergillus flavus NRRL3357]|nr:hypothetical protein AFLA_007881 [Aspergillus flavus NRRL3357]
MDFILSLTHFCEVHGPTSIICSQVLPFSCSQCYPDRSDFSPDDTPATSHDTVSSHLQSPTYGKDTNSSKLHGKLPGKADFEKIEDHPYFIKPQANSAEAQQRLNPLGGADGDTCASCSLTLPDNGKTGAPFCARERSSTLAAQITPKPKTVHTTRMYTPPILSLYIPRRLHLTPLATHIFSPISRYEALQTQRIMLFSDVLPFEP